MQLYDDLLKLTQDSEAFYFQDFDLDGRKYRIFNYRLASYSDFLAPSAIECRGSMFEVDQNGQFVRIASRPMQKFFNLNENPLTMNLDLSKVDTVELKADGSLMSTYLHNDQLRLKSKGSLFSEQAIDAMKWLNQPEQDMLLVNLQSLAEQDVTVNLEWCAPHNRIVIGYAQSHLKVLNARRNSHGTYVPREVLFVSFGPEYLIDRVNTNGLDVAAFVQSIPAMQDDIEGYVARIGDLWFKIKTEKYMSLHHAKDSINNPRRLFEAIVDEGIDDLRSMFAHDTLAITQIDEMQTKVTKMYNHLVTVCTGYYDQNKSEDRKTYAIGAQKLDLQGIRLLGPVMNLYLGKDPDFKGFLKAKYKELGFKDTSVEKSE